MTTLQIEGNPYQRQKWSLCMLPVHNFPSVTRIWNPNACAHKISWGRGSRTNEEMVGGNLSQTLTGFWRGRFSRHLGQQAAIHSKGVSLQPPLHCEPALAGALDSVQPIEEPQSRCDGQVEDAFTYRALPRLNLPSAFTIHAFWLARLWRTRRGTVPGARLFDLSG